MREFSEAHNQVAAPPTPVVAVFDIGKTNKKRLLFDAHYRVVEDRATQLAEVEDEAGDPCEDVSALTAWVEQGFSELLARRDIELKAVNVSAYGASLVYLDAEGQVVAPLYNYLKPYPKELQERFFDKHGGSDWISVQTASPVLGSLNSGLQLYRIKHEQPELFARIKYALHLPQYVSYVLSRRAVSELTSVGCHTMLWDFAAGDYHAWVRAEGLLDKLAPLAPASDAIEVQHGSKSIKIGVGLHDSSAALIPYLSSFTEPFVLLSTGTWCIALNPFNHAPLTPEELAQDCLCYLSYEGRPVKAARYFGGHQHDQGVKRLAAHFAKEENYYQGVAGQGELLRGQTGGVPFAQRNLAEFASYEAAYHALVQELVTRQVEALRLVLTGGERHLYVDGGFSKNPLFMHGLAAALPHMKVCAATVAQASALGAALALHGAWNGEQLPMNLVALKESTRTHNRVL